MTQRTLIRFFLLGLPLGLVLLGVAATVLYFRPLGSWPSYRSANKVTDEGRRRPISEKDLRDYVRILAVEIGARPATDGARMDQTATWIESTLGPSNIGFEVRNEIFDMARQRYRNLSVDIPGREIGVEVVVVAAHYDSAPGSRAADSNASGVAAVLSLANAMIGELPRRTLRFALWAAHAREAAGCDVSQSGGRAFVSACAARGERISALVQLHGLAVFSSETTSQMTAIPGAEEPLRSSTGDFIVVTGERTHRTFIDDVIQVFQRRSSIPVQRLIFAERRTWKFDEGRWPTRGDFLEAAPSAMWLPSPGPASAVLVTDSGPFRKRAAPSEDGPDDLDYTRYTQVVRGLEGVLRDLANR